MVDQPRILLVDDEIGICGSCRKALGRHGYEVDYVLNAEDALERLRDEKYDVVVTDLKMPGMDGMQLMARIRASTPDTQVVMITAYSTVRSAVEAMKAGAFDYLPKPFGPEEISAVVARALVARPSKAGAAPADGTIAAVSHALPAGDAAQSRPLDRSLDCHIPAITPEAMLKMWCIRGHSWARIEADNSVVAGVDAMFLRAMRGTITKIELPERGKLIQQGEPCARLWLESGLPGYPARSLHNVWSPVGGTVLQTNDEVFRTRGLIEEHPYEQGWLLRIFPVRLDSDLVVLSPFVESGAGQIAAEKHLKLK